MCVMQSEPSALMPKYGDITALGGMFGGSGFLSWRTVSGLLYFS